MQSTASPTQAPHLQLVEKLLVLLDAAMLVLVAANLLLILFEMVYAGTGFANLLAVHTPLFQQWYDVHVHQRFVAIDLLFVAVYLTEFLFSWSVAVARQTYERWYVYPIAHWYDLLGCIPIDAFRFMRILRVISLLSRLHRAGIIDLNNNYFLRKFRFLLSVFAEEITDRVIVNIVSSTQADLVKGSPTLHRINNTVIRERREQLTRWADDELGLHLLQLLERNEVGFKAYLADILETTIAKNIGRGSLGRQLGRLPASKLANVFYDAVYTVAEDIANPAHNRILDLLEAASGPALAGEIPAKGEPEAGVIEQTLVDILEIVKQQVGIRSWAARSDLNG